MKRSLIAKTIYPEQTKHLGELFAKMLIKLIGSTPIVIGVTGDPNSGKTTFIQGLAKGFGVAEEEISPSSFQAIARYQGEEVAFYLVDPYRPEELNTLKPQLETILKEPNSVIAVERADRIKELLPEDAILLNIVDLKATERALMLYPQPNTPIPEAFETLRRLEAF